MTETRMARARLRAILPDDVAFAEAIGEVPEASLLAEEEAALGQVAPVRRREYTTARHCARRALGAIGVAPAAILSGPNREPLWPEDIVGSLTHCRGYCAAAVARRGRFVSLGIDAEPHDALPHGVLSMIASPGERELLEALPRNGIAWDRVMFSAKESVYKAWFPLAARWLGFEDVAMTIDGGAGTFRARLLVPGPAVAGRVLTEIGGRFAVEDGLVFTAVVIAAESPR